MGKFRLQGIDFSLQGLVLGGESLDLLAAHFHEFGVAFLLGVMERLLTCSFRLHRLDLATDGLHCFLGKSRRSEQSRTEEQLAK